MALRLSEGLGRIRSVALDMEGSTLIAPRLDARGIDYGCFYPQEEAASLAASAAFIARSA